jgi:hypothetical protein
MEPVVYYMVAPETIQINGNEITGTFVPDAIVPEDAIAATEL